MKKMIVSILLIVPAYAMAGGGGCESCPPPSPKDLLAKCEIKNINKLESDALPKGEHHSFSSASKLLSKFIVGSGFFLQGGYVYQNILSIYYASFDPAKKFSDFFEYSSSVPVGTDPFEFPEIKLHNRHTFSMYNGVFPVVENTLLYMSKSGSENDVEFNLIWNYAKSFRDNSDILVASGAMSCDLTQEVEEK